MPPQVTCVCGSCRKCKHRKYMREYYWINRDRVIETVKRSRANNIDKIRERDRGRGYRVYDESKVFARSMVHKAKKSGRLIPQPCEVCGSVERIHAHHEDYRRALDVRWLCPAHHGEVHRRKEAV